MSTKANKVNNGNKMTFTEGPGCNTPQVSARSSWRFHEGDSAKRPQHDRVCLSASLAAGEGMSKFVQQNDTKERAIFQCCPNWIVIPVRESRHFKRSDNEPGEMQIHAYSCQPEYWQRAFHGHRGAEHQQIAAAHFRGAAYSFDSVPSFWVLIHKRIGIIEESTKPCFRKNACATFSGRSVSSVIRRKFFFFAKSIACSRSLLP